MINGSIFIIISFVIAGIILSHNEREVIKQRQGIILLLKHINEGVAFKGQALCDIYTSFENPALEKCKFTEYLKNKLDINPLYSGFKYCKALRLDNIQRQRFENFAEEISKMQSNEAFVKLSEVFLKSIIQEFEIQNKASRDKIMLYLKLSPLAGFFTLMLIL